MINKRGQVTIFVIVAILIVASVAIYFSVLGNQEKEIDTINTDSLYTFVQSCFESTSEEIIYYTALGGGYYFPNHDLTIGAGTPAYLIEGKNHMPTKKEIENEISLFISKKLPFCIKNFEKFPQYNISHGEMNIKTNIMNYSILIDLEYPIYVSRGKAVNEIDYFSTEINVRLGLVYDSITNAINSETENGIYLNKIWEELEERNLYLDMFDYDNRTIIFIWKDEQSKINDKELEYIYANVY